VLKTQRLRLAGHVLRQPEVMPANVAMNWTPEEGKRSRERLQKDLAYDICRRSTRHGSNMERRKETPAIARDGGISSPDVLKRTGGPKSKLVILE